MGENNMLIRKYRISKHNSTVCGYPGRDYDWTKFCWDGSAIYVDWCGCRGHKKEKHKAPLPFADDCLIGNDSQYIHVPYAWDEQSTIVRVRPNDCMWAGEIYRGTKIIKQTAICEDGIWYWVLECEDRV